jgi:proteic killer suppression protein
MIKSFRDKGLQRFAAKGDPSKLSVRKEARITRMLTALDNATAPGDMAMPGWGFHPLTGNRAGTYSVSVSGNWRITFKFAGQDAIDVDLEDYH